MRRASWLIGMFLLLTVFLANAKMDGYCVSVQFRQGSAPENSYPGKDPKWRGNVNLYTIRGNVITKCDTLHSRSNGLAQAPVFSLDGQRVAFYRYGVRVSGNSLAGTTDSSHVSIVNIDGTGLADLCAIPAPDPNLELAWPAGDWIYYEMPAWYDGYMNEGQLEIWRVNYKTKANQKICKFNNGAALAQYSYIWRFSLSASGARMGLQVIGSANAVYTFPPPNGNFSAPGCGLFGCGSCNAAVSASGYYIGTYGGGNHLQLILCSSGEGSIAKGDIPNADRPTTDQVHQWSGVSCTTPGEGCEKIYWAANSDKWLNQRIFGWNNAADKSPSNSFAVNWIEKEAILCQTACNTNSSLSNTSGQIWVAGGPAGNYRQETNGTWVKVDTLALGPTPVSDREVRATASPRICSRAGQISVSPMQHAAITVELIDVHGRCVVRHTSLSAITISTHALTPGTCTLNVRNGSMKHGRSVVVGM